MENASEELFAYLTSESVFTDMMESRLYPIAAGDKAEFPFATYRIIDVPAKSKDGFGMNIELMFWFKPTEYKKCVGFLDAMKPVIENKNDYDWQFSLPDFIEENQSYVGIINFNKN